MDQIKMDGIGTCWQFWLSRGERTYFEPSFGIADVTIKLSGKFKSSARIMVRNLDEESDNESSTEVEQSYWSSGAEYILKNLRPNTKYRITVVSIPGTFDQVKSHCQEIITDPEKPRVEISTLNGLILRWTREWRVEYYIEVKHHNNTKIDHKIERNDEDEGRQVEYDVSLQRLEEEGLISQNLTVLLWSQNLTGRKSQKFKKKVIIDHLQLRPFILSKGTKVLVHLAIDKCGDTLDEDDYIQDLPQGYKNVSEVLNPFKVTGHCSVSFPAQKGIKKVIPKKKILKVREIIQGGALTEIFEISPKEVEPCIPYRLCVKVSSKTGKNEIYFNWKAPKSKVYSDDMVRLSYTIMQKDDYIVVIHSEGDSANEMHKTKAKYNKQGYKHSDEQYVEFTFSSVVTVSIESGTIGHCKHPLIITPLYHDIQVGSLRQGRVNVITFICSLIKSSSYLEYHLRRSDNTVIHKCPFKVEISEARCIPPIDETEINLTYQILRKDLSIAVLHCLESTDLGEVTHTYLGQGYIEMSMKQTVAISRHSKLSGRIENSKGAVEVTPPLQQIDFTKITRGKTSEIFFLCNTSQNCDITVVYHFCADAEVVNKFPIKLEVCSVNPSTKEKPPSLVNNINFETMEKKTVGMEIKDQGKVTQNQSGNKQFVGDQQIHQP